MKYEINGYSIKKMAPLMSRRQGNRPFFRVCPVNGLRCLSLINTAVIGLVITFFTATDLPAFSYMRSGITTIDQGFSNNRLNDIENKIINKAQQEATLENWKTVSRLLEGQRSDKAQQLYIRSLYMMGKYSELINHIDSLSSSTRFRLFRSIAPYYLLSSVRIEESVGLVDVLGSQKVFYPDVSSEGFKQVIYSLLAGGFVDQAIELIDLLPEDIYQAGEKDFILGITNYYSQDIRVAEQYFSSIDKKHDFYDGAVHYLSLIYYRIGEVPDFADSEEIKLLNDEIKYNIALTMLKTGKIDDANSVALQIGDQNLRTRIELFVAWESKHYRTVVTLVENIDDFSYIGNCLSTLIVAESYYHTQQYRDAEAVFKMYSTFDKADKQYANHAQGHSFKGFYRYNSTAYYWIKNLENQPSFYDSLAAYNLARLYAFTENYYSADNYFDYYINRYGLPEDDPEFISDYVTTQYGQGNLANYGELLIEFKNILPLRDVVDGLIYLGNHHHENDKPLQALDYWQHALDLEDNDDLLLKTYRLRFSMNQFRDSEEFILTLIERYPQSSFVDDLSLDLTKFYLTQERFETTESFIDSLLVSGVRTDSLLFDNKPHYTDSLRYFKGLALKHKGVLHQALDHFYALNHQSTTSNLREPILHNMRTIINRIPAKQALDILGDYIEEDHLMREEYLYMMAEVYQRQHLYAEANRIYSLIDDDHSYRLDTERTDNDSLFTVPYRQIDTELHYRLALNEIRQRNYTQALDYINEIINFRNEINEDILFLSYLAHYSLGKNDKAINILLDLYYKFPDSSKRFEITKNLIEQFVENERDLYAWFFMKDYYPLATVAEQWQLDQYRESLARKLEEDTLAVSIYLEPLLDQGIKLHTILADSLLYKREGKWYSPLLENAIISEKEGLDEDLDSHLNQNNQAEDSNQ